MDNYLLEQMNALSTRFFFLRSSVRLQSIVHSRLVNTNRSPPIQTSSTIISVSPPLPSPHPIQRLKIPPKLVPSISPASPKARQRPRVLQPTDSQPSQSRITARQHTLTHTHTHTHTHTRTDAHTQTNGTSSKKPKLGTRLVSYAAISRLQGMHDQAKPNLHPDSGAYTPTAENVGAVFYNTEVLFCKAVGSCFSMHGGCRAL